MTQSKPKGTEGLLPRSVIAKRPEYAEVIGMISIEIANLEIMLGELLAGLLHIDRHFGRVIYLTPQSNLARISIVENVLRDTLSDKSPGRKRIEDLLGRAKSVIGKRHEIIHNAWGVKEENINEVARRALPFKETSPARTVPINELTELIEKIRKLIDDVMTETDGMFRNWPPYTWRRKSPARPTGAPDPSERPQKVTAPKRKPRASLSRTDS